MTQDQEQPTRRSRDRSGHHAAAKLTDQQVAQALQEELRAVGDWVLGVLNAQPGWERMEVDLKPQGGRIWLRITEHRDGRVLPGTVGPIKPGSPVLRRINRLQSLSYRPGRGTWLSTVVSVMADGWPTPQYSFATAHNFDERPPTLGEEGSYSLEDGLEHLESFPRTQARVPGWLAQLAAESGQSIQVLAPEAEAESTPEGTVNPRLREAVAGFAAAPSDTALIEVMRQATAGDLLVDATGSTLIRTDSGELSPESQIQLQSFAEPDGTRTLAAYTAAVDARAMFERSGQEGEPVLLRQPAAAVLDLVGADDQYDHLILDAGGASCRIPRRQIEWLLSSPRNDVAKNGLLVDNIPQVLSGLVAANGVLLLGVRPVEGAQGADDVEPVWAKPQEGQDADTLLLFTSAAEVAALDPTLEIRSAAGRDVLRYALGTGAEQVCINARPPVATFSMEDIRSVLDSIATPSTSPTQHPSAEIMD
ncbi:SseB family protein [Kocuria sp.]|uniref:SseB family protein n=1 Tax=Kocuria sp. TaxID=1871328 RepID=UPI0026DF4682|nr:SseB family protein [Kocuria sp.]MDO5617458.1 SseB family protein [Kocuria sp.]